MDFFKEKSISRGDKPIYMFHEEKNQHAKSFTNRKSVRNKFHELKSARIKLHEQSQFQEEKKSILKLHKENKQNVISFTNKTQHAASSMNKISFTRRKINVNFNKAENKHTKGFRNAKKNQ